jgi:hypothetical protein
LGRQNEFKLISEERELRFRLGLAGQHQFAAVSGREMHIDDLRGGEFFDGTARCQAGGQCMEAPAEGDVEAIGKEGDQDAHLDAHLFLVKDRANGEVALEVADRLLPLTDTRQIRSAHRTRR